MTLGSIIYARKDVEVTLGQTVTWNNVDARTGQKHSVTSGTDPRDYASNGWNGDGNFDSHHTDTLDEAVASPLMQNGTSYSHTFTAVGTYPYFCKRVIKNATTGAYTYVHAVNGMKGSVKVVYNWLGFRQPVDGGTTVNVAKAGSGVPVKFSLAGDQGLDVLAVTPKSQAVNCDGGAPTDVIEETVTAGSSGLSYDTSTDTYTYVWKTDKAWAGQCRDFILHLKDGTQQVLHFKFTR